MHKSTLQQQKFISLSIILFWTFQLHAQVFQFDQSIAVIENERSLKNPFAGGLNGVQPSWLDLNLDNQKELVMFDRSNNLAYAFEFVEGSYEWRPYLSDNLPGDIQNWMISVDYDGDGLNDIFTHTSFGVRVYHNVSTEHTTAWEVAADNLKSLSNGSEVNLVVTGSDYPAIGDFDNDGDVDILVFDFATGNFITYYRNTSTENNSDLLSYEKADNFWGMIEECNCNQFSFGGNPCGSIAEGRTEHAASKSITIYNDDLYIGIDGCTELAYLPNSGQFASPQFDSFQVDLFELTVFKSYPIVYFGDFDQDGIDDAIIGNNLRNDGYFLDYGHSVRFFKGPELALETTNFLQSDMIDLGEQSYPALYDWDKDGDLDLFVGNKGELHGNTYYGTIYHYENTGNFRTPRFELISKDFGGFSQYEWVKLIPFFGDFNNDGNTDILLSAGKSDKLFAQINFLEGTGNHTFQPPVQWDFDFSRNDTPTLFDWNNDGLMDLFLGKSFGNISYYQNTGTNQSAVLSLETDKFLGTIADGTNLFPTITFYDVDDDGAIEIIKSDARGYLNIYQDELDNAPDSLNSLNPESEQLAHFRLGTTNPMVFGDLYGTGDTYGFIGNIMGGLHAIKKVRVKQPEDQSLIAFPNPTSQGRISIYSTVNDQLIITDLTGKLILQGISIEAEQELNVSINSLYPGLYIIKGKHSQFKFYVR